MFQWSQQYAVLHYMPDPNLVALSFVHSMKAVVYFNARIVKENYKPEDLAAELEHVTADAATPYENMEKLDETENRSRGSDTKAEIV